MAIINVRDVEYIYNLVDTLRGTEKQDKYLRKEFIEVNEIREWLKEEIHRSGASTQILEEFDKEIKMKEIQMKEIKPVELMNNLINSYRHLDKYDDVITRGKEEEIQKWEEELLEHVQSLKTQEKCYQKLTSEGSKKRQEEWRNLVKCGFQEMKTIITPKDLIDKLCPEHDRTSCSDNNIQNGFYSSTEHTRCSRCTMLQTLKEGKMPESHTGYYSVTIDVKISKKELKEKWENDY